MEVPEFLLRIEGYRCFVDPVELTIRRDGFITLVGSNNSGKSTILRAIYELRPLFNLFLDDIQITNLLTQNRVYFSALSRDPLSVINNETSNPVLIGVTVLTQREDEIAEVQFTISELTEPSGSSKVEMSLGTKRNSEETRFSGAAVSYGASGQRIFEDSGGGRPARFDASAITAVFSLLINSFYCGPERSLATFGNPTRNYFDLLTNDTLIAKWLALQTSVKVTEQRTTREVIRLLKSFFGFTELSIVSSAEGFGVTIDDQVYRLEEIGAGFAEALLLLTNVAIKRPSLLLLDEPGMHLHPSKKVEFVTLLANFASFSTLIATHDVGLMRSLPGDTFLVQKTDQGRSSLSKIDDQPSYSQRMGELGFATYPFNKGVGLLLIEGATDLLIYQHWLSLLGLADQFVILPLGGSNIINSASSDQVLKELSQVGPAVAVIIDRETSDPENSTDIREAFKLKCQSHGFDVLILKNRATENYFTSAACQASGSDFLGPYGERKGKKVLRKSENWKIAMQMKKEDIEPTDIGTFLQCVVAKLRQTAETAVQSPTSPTPPAEAPHPSATDNSPDLPASP